MVNTRRQRGNEEIPESRDPSPRNSPDNNMPHRERAGRRASDALNASNNGQNNGARRGRNQDNASVGPRSPNASNNGNNDGPPPPHTPPLSPASSANASLAGPGLRGRQLLELAGAEDRTTYLEALEAMNETFARQLRQKGVQIPRRECSFSSLC